ncbi:ABC transporter permease subunit [Oscillospiraceae bacterium MB08-C2-2]|nr:ABC transporter permease subunit [Oscillospiraceae bacterium MB08-C2-2]
MQATKKRGPKGSFTAPFAMLSPVATWLILLVAVPLLYILAISFFSTDEAHNIVMGFSFDNYTKLFNPTLLTIYGNSLVISFLTTLFCILIGYPFAYIMARTSPFQKTLMMVFLMLPFWTNSLVRLYGWRTILGTNGYLNSMLLSLGLIESPLQIMFTREAVVLGMVYVFLPYMVLPIHSVVDKLDKSLLEAAGDLGARPVRRFIHVTLPLTASGIFAGAIMVFIPSLGAFFVADLMGGAKSQLIGNVISRQFKEAFNWPFGAALSIILILITLLLVRVYTKLGGNVDDLGVG